ncbi:MAG: RidA family protein [Alphaproteobacteria bacterium]
MSSRIETRLAELGIELPTAAPPGANYIPVVQSGSLLFVSGQVSSIPDSQHYGKLGADLDVGAGQTAARVCAISLLSQLKGFLGDLDAVSRFVKLTGFVNCTPDFTDIHLVMNGCSDFLVEVYGDAGRHARSAIGMGSLPLGFAVEVEGIIEVS